MSPTSQSLALALVVDDAFLPGALVTLDSFRRHHRWFNGPIIIIHDESLSSNAQTTLTETFAQVRFQTVRGKTREKIAKLVSSRPHLKHTQRRFHSLELFALHDIDRVLFCDADLLFQASIDSLLTINEPFVATPDRAALVGEKWGVSSPAPVPSADGEERHSFNAGLMLIRGDLLNEPNDTAVQDLLDPSVWTETIKGHTDQAVLNRHFYGKVHLADVRFNYLLRISKTIESQTGHTPESANVLHYNQIIKPWQLAQLPVAPAENIPAPEAVNLWFQAYQRALAHRHHRRQSLDTSRKFLGAQYPLEQQITTHLFIISPNNSGSTFLKNVLESSRHTWNLRREGQHQFGVSGPNPSAMGVPLIWAADESTLNTLKDPGAYDWTITRRAWYFHSFSRSSLARVFVEKSPPHLLHVEALQSNFKNAKFIFLVRNPFAMAEGIIRRVATKFPHRNQALAGVARHIVTCFEIQRQNIERFGADHVVTTYEDMCHSPENLEAKIRALEPSLTDLYLDQAVEVKGMYHEPLRNMNAQQIARLSAADISMLESHFEPHSALFKFFGYATSL